MFYVDDKDGNGFNGGGCIFWIIVMILAIIFAVFACLYDPPIDPPTHMKSSDPYWYSGN